MPEKHTGKVFGIGLSKTGTSSLQYALTTLGYKCYHMGAHNLTEEDLRDADAFCDQWVAVRFKEWDERFPDARFVYTTRDIQDWVNSVFLTQSPLELFHGEARERVLACHRAAFGDTDWMDRNAWVAGYERHDRAVREHFAGRDDLLVLDICAGEGLEKLCPFLGCEMIEGGFPWINRRQ